VGLVLYALSVVLLAWLARSGLGGGVVRYLNVLLFERGLIPQLEVAAFWIGVSMLLLRIEPLIRDHRVLGAVSAALSEDRDGGGRSADPARRVLDAEPRETLTSSVCRRLMERARTAAEPAELDAFIDQISELERRKVEASQESIRYIIYLIPTLGFTGTVLGISDAVMGFSSVVGTNAEAATLQRTLVQICTSLGVSFDTTLIALVLSAILALAKAVIDRFEMVLASAVDEMAISQLRPVLDVAPVRTPNGMAPGGMAPPMATPMATTSASTGEGQPSRAPVLLLQNERGEVTNIREVAEQVVEEALCAALDRQPAKGGEGDQLRDHVLGRRMLELLEAKAVLAEQLARHMRDSAVRREDVASMREVLLGMQSTLEGQVRAQQESVEALTQLVLDLRMERQTRTELDDRLAALLEALRRDGIPARVRLTYQVDQG
jgi:biopolymer transport protein ExbB/TolQ